MNNLNLKGYWRKIVGWREGDGKKSVINPGIIWVTLICLFFVGLLVIAGLGILLNERISNKEEGLLGESSVMGEKLDEKKLDIILLDHSYRVEKFKLLEVTKPPMIDPGA